MHNVEGNVAVPVVVSLATGILFIFILNFALNPSMLVSNDYREDDRRTIDKIAQHQAVQLFLDKYPHSQRAYSISSDTGLPYWVSYHATARTVLDYSSPTLMTERGIRLLLMADEDVEVKRVMLFCGDAQNITIAEANVTGEDEVIRWLKDDLC